MGIKTVAILGAGIMGTQIAALLAQANQTVYLFDLNKMIVLSSIQSLKNLSGELNDSEALLIQAFDYEQLDWLKHCDLIIEAIPDQIDYKLSLYKKIAPYINPVAYLVTTSAGLGIHALVEGLNENVRARFCGIHFFNPPRHIKLVEIIPHLSTHQSTLNNIETFLVDLGKGVIFAKDTPYFIGDRMSVFSMVSCLHHAERFMIMPDLLDALTGVRLNRPETATCKMMDLMGLDKIAQRVSYCYSHLTEDPWRHYFRLPDWVHRLIDKGALGHKNQAGIYKKENNKLLVYHQDGYRSAIDKLHPAMLKILAIKNPEERFAALRTSTLAPAQFLWAYFRDLFHYVAHHREKIAHSYEDIDWAFKWGQGWAEGPFELWKKANWAQIRTFIEDDIKLGNAPSVSLPGWIYTVDGLYSDKVAD